MCSSKVKECGMNCALSLNKYTNRMLRIHKEMSIILDAP